MKCITKLAVILLIAGGSVAAVMSSSVTAVDKVNKNAADFSSGSTDAMLKNLAEMITEKAKEEGKDIDGKVVLDVLALTDAKTYAFSSDKQGAEYVNQAYLHNGGSDKGIWPLFGGQSEKLVVTEMAPAGADLAVQFRLDLRTAEALVNELMIVLKADEKDLEGFTKQMKEIIPSAGLTGSEMLAKANIRLNLVVDLNKEVKLPTPIGEIDRPRLAIRIDEVKWVWPFFEEQIASAGMPLNKVEKDGVITYTLPNQMAAGMMNYLPVIVMDQNKDSLWICSTAEFLAQCQSGKDTLAESAEFKAVMNGLQDKGSTLSYLSKDGADFVVSIIENGKAKSGEGSDPEIDRFLDILKPVELGTASVLTRDATGLHLSERSTWSIKQQFNELCKELAPLLESTKE